MILCIVLARAKTELWLGWGAWQTRRHVNWDSKNDRNSSSVGGEKAGWVGGGRRIGSIYKDLLV